MSKVLKKIRELNGKGYSDEQIEAAILSGLDTLENGDFSITEMEDIEEKVSSILIRLGVHANIRGFGYLKTAIMFSYNDSSYIEQITKRLYPDIAKKHNTTPSKVERCIRHAIKKVEATETKEKDSLFPVSAKKLTNSAFIATIVEKMKI